METISEPEEGEREREWSSISLNLETAFNLVRIPSSSSPKANLTPRALPRALPSALLSALLNALLSVLVARIALLSELPCASDIRLALIFPGNLFSPWQIDCEKGLRDPEPETRFFAVRSSRKLLCGPGGKTRGLCDPEHGF